MAPVVAQMLWVCNCFLRPLAPQARVADGRDGPILPHPRLHERAFVLFPLQEVAPDWCHPLLDLAVSELVAALPADHGCAPLDGAPRDP